MPIASYGIVGKNKILSLHRDLKDIWKLRYRVLEIQCATCDHHQLVAMEKLLKFQQSWIWIQLQKFLSNLVFLIMPMSGIKNKSNKRISQWAWLPAMCQALYIKHGSCMQSPQYFIGQNKKPIQSMGLSVPRVYTTQVTCIVLLCCYKIKSTK